MSVLRSFYENVLSEEKLARWAAIVAGFILFIVVAVNAVSIILRKIIGWSIPGVYEITGESMMFTLAFPAAYIAMKKGHIMFEALTDRLPIKVQMICDAFAALLGAFLFGALSWATWVQALHSFSINEYISGIVNTPVWPFRFVLFVGLVIFTLYQVILFVIDCGSIKAGGKPKKDSPVNLTIGE